MASWLTDLRRFRLRLLLASTCPVLAEALSVLPALPDPLRVTGFGFTLARITVRPSRTRFAGRLNSGVSRLGEFHEDHNPVYRDRPIGRRHTAAMVRPVGRRGLTSPGITHP